MEKLNNLNNVAIPAPAEATTTADVSNTSNTTPAEATTAVTAPATTTTPADSGNIPAADMALAGMVSARNVELTRSRRGIPCLWENGGGYSNTGEAQIITDGQGYPKRAIYVRTHGDLACGDHALIPVRMGDHIVTVSRHWNRVAIRVERIASIEADTATLVSETEPINKAAIDAATIKSRDYHCRRPYYITNN